MAKSQTKRLRGANAYRGGLSAEQAVSRLYDRRGAAVLEHRWRGLGGEIDLIVQDNETIVFVEVKCGRTHDEAALRLRPEQMNRILASASGYLEHCPDGSLSETRVDVALVDQVGAVSILENAFGHG